MKKKIIEEKNKNGIYTKKTITEKNSDDGFFNENKENIATSWSDTNNPPRSVWHNGPAAKFSYTTNDPRITRPFVYTILGIFLIIGIICLLFHSWILGIAFTTISLFALSTAKKNIDSIEKGYRNQGYDMDSKEEKEKVRNEFVDSMKDGFDEVKKSIFKN